MDDDRPQLLFVYGEKSGPSRKVEAFLAQVLQHRHNHDSFKLVRVSADQHPELLERFRITEVPAIVVIEDQRITLTVSPVSRRSEIEDALAPWLR